MGEVDGGMDVGGVGNWDERPRERKDRSELLLLLRPSDPDEEVELRSCARRSAREKRVGRMGVGVASSRKLSAVLMIDAASVSTLA